MAEAAHPDANIIFGAMVDEKLDDQVWVTVVATGYGERPPARAGARGAGRRAARAPRSERAASRREPAATACATEPTCRELIAASASDLDVPEFMPARAEPRGLSA